MITPRVSIVIVCMNNLKNIYPCLSSIKEFTSISYEVLVVTYLFSKDNLIKLKSDFPWVIIIESDEIRGFAENNNLALRKAKGEYSFILNDDTFILSPVIDQLVSSFEMTENVTIMSPNILYPDGRAQVCGRNKYSAIDWLLLNLRINGVYKKKSIHEGKSDIFQSYNISGAAFLIKTEVFRHYGFFDEIYFFCPEDIALSTKINSLGGKCYVDANILLYHEAQNTASKMNTAVLPSRIKGELIFFSSNSFFKLFILSVITFIMRFLFVFSYIPCVFFSAKKRILFIANINVCYTIFSKKTPKEIFKYFYLKLLQNEN